MSKPALGRGLGRLLAATENVLPSPWSPTGSKDDKPFGVQMLLRGSNGETIVPPAPETKSSPDLEVSRCPSWAVGVLLLADLLLVCIGAWIALASRGFGRTLVAGLVILLGGALLSLGVWLRGAPAAAELQSLNPLEVPEPRVRIRFLEEKPPSRK